MHRISDSGLLQSVRDLWLAGFNQKETVALMDAAFDLSVWQVRAAGSQWLHLDTLFKRVEVKDEKA